MKFVDDDDDISGKISLKIQSGSVYVKLQTDRQTHNGRVKRNLIGRGNNSNITTAVCRFICVFCLYVHFYVFFSYCIYVILL